MSSRSCDAFALDEAKASDWLSDLVTAYEMALAFGETSPLLGDDLPLIGMNWNPLDLGGPDNAYFLVRAAQQKSLLTGAEGMLVTFEYIDDGEPGAYRWILDIPQPTPLKLASLSEGLPVLVAEEVRGAEAAMEVLREAVREANHLLRQLSDHISARETPDSGS